MTAISRLPEHPRWIAWLDLANSAPPRIRFDSTDQPQQGLPIRALQRLLELNEDSHYGPQTARLLAQACLNAPSQGDPPTDFVRDFHLPRLLSWLENQAEQAPPGTPVFFSQVDPRWAERTLGEERSFRRSGCAVVACASALSALCSPAQVLPAPPDGTEPDPLLHLDAYLDGHGGYIGDSLVWARVADFAAQHGVRVQHHRINAAQPQDAADLLDEGLWPLLGVRHDYNQHFVLGVGWRRAGEEVDVQFLDPGQSRNSVEGGGADGWLSTCTIKGGYRLERLDYFRPIA